MQTLLADRLKQATMELRKMEKQHFQKVQELHGGGISSNNTRQSDEGLVLNLDEEDEVEMSRSKEV